MQTIKQTTLATAGFEAYSKTTRKAAFLARMERLVPWAEFMDLIEPYYPKAGNGRPPRALATMLRMYCISNWFDLSDVACEDALYDTDCFRSFCGVDLGREGVPDATTLLNFSHLMERHQLGQALDLELTPFHGHLMVLAEGVRSVQTAHPQAAVSGAIS